MDARTLLKQYNLRPNKSLGQNFLVNPAILTKIADAAKLTPDDTVLEIGAGFGTLTEQLAGQAGRVVAVEIDGKLLPILKNALTGLKNVTVTHGDILTLDPGHLIKPATKYKVVANLPYYITSAVIRHLLEAAVPPQRMVITVQREVAERIIAKPGKMSLLAVSVQFYGQPQILFRIRPGSFYPAPDVESAVVQIDVYTTPTIASDLFPNRKSRFCPTAQAIAQYTGCRPGPSAK
jgi:16S rRNA (adenine1518-N6/adenine1519-N6)-dimethyltransferase